MKKIRNAALALTVNLSLVSTAIAAPRSGIDQPEVENPTQGASLGDLLAKVIDALLLFAGAVAVLFLIIGGFRYVVSAGNPDQVEAAKKTILYAVLGLIIIFIAFVLVKLIQQYLGVEGFYTITE